MADTKLSALVEISALALTDEIYVESGLASFKAEVGKLRVILDGISPTESLITDGLFHVISASAGVVAASTNADELVLENDINTGMTILVNDSGNIGAYVIGSPVDNFAARLQYQPSSGTLFCLSGNQELWRGTTSLLTINENALDHDFRVESVLNPNMLFVDAGNNSVHIDNNLLTGAGDGDLVMANSAHVGWNNAAGTTSGNTGISLDASDNLRLDLPATNDLFLFRWAGSNRLQFQFSQSAVGILYIGESSTDHADPGANNGILYIKDVAGRTNLFWRDNTGVRSIDLT